MSNYEFQLKKEFKKLVFLQSDHVIKSFNCCLQEKTMFNEYKPKAVGPGADDNANNHANNTSSSQETITF